jgi:hypothetical protein
MGVLQLLGPDQTTVLWDFDDSTGAANPSTVITNLGADLDMGTLPPALSTFASSDFGATPLGYTNPPVEMTIPFMASATSDDNLWAGLGQLARYLGSISVMHPLYLKWTELTEVRYIDLIGVLEMPQLLRGQRAGSLIAGRKNSLGPIGLKLLRQPWMRGPTVTSSAVTVPNDPATSTKVRVFPLTVTGDLPTPGKIQVEMDAGSTVERVMIGHRARQSRASSFFADYLSDTGFFQCEATGRSWTITLGTDVTAVDPTEDGSPGSGSSVARVATAGGSVGVMTRRVRATRTTKLDSLRGSWRPQLRCKADGAGRWEIQMRWGPSTADPVAFSNDIVVHDTSLSGTPATFGYVELDMGRVYFPDVIALGGLAIEIWAMRTSGTGNLDLDFVWFTPAMDLATVVVPGATVETFAATALSEVASPVTSPGAGTEASISGSRRRFADVGDNAGTAPNTGTLYAAGRHRFVFDIAGTSGGTATCKLNVRNITDAADAVSRTGVSIPINSRANYLLEMDLPSGTNATTDLYQAQVDDPATATIDLYSISHEYLPALASGEAVRTDPGERQAVDRLDSSDNLAGYLAIEGQIPAVLEPGDNHIMVRADEIPLALYEEPQNKLARTPTVTVVYDPRYAL